MKLCSVEIIRIAVKGTEVRVIYIVFRFCIADKVNGTLVTRRGAKGKQENVLAKVNYSFS